MDSEWFDKPHRRHQRELDIVPILDMLTAIIFFLLLTTTFVEYTKQTLPPSESVILSDPASKAPVSPRLLVSESGGEVHIVLDWQGETPGKKNASTALDAAKYPTGVKESVSKLLGEFKQSFPGEATIRVGLSEGAAYQTLIAVMDGVREQIADIVLISPEEVASR